MRDGEKKKPWFSCIVFVLHLQLYAPHGALCSGDSGSISHVPVCSIKLVHYSKYLRHIKAIENSGYYN